MYDERTRRTASTAVQAGESLSSVSRRFGVSRATLRDWRDRPVPGYDPTACRRCTSGKLASEYAHLLGLYLGDGCLSEGKKQVYALRIACDDRFPRLIDEAEATILAVHPGRPVHRAQAPGCTSVVSYWKH